MPALDSDYAQCVLSELTVSIHTDATAGLFLSHGEDCFRSDLWQCLKTGVTPQRLISISLTQTKLVNKENLKKER